MPISFDLVTFDAPDPDRLARFWCAALGLVEVEREDAGRWLVLAAADGRRVLGLQRGAMRPGSVHLDLTCSVAEFDAELVRLQAFGGALVGQARQESYGSIANLADPDGNLFDLCAYG